jgi:hypothetical protein
MADMYFPMGISVLFHFNSTTNTSEKFIPLYLLLFIREVSPIFPMSSIPWYTT